MSLYRYLIYRPMNSRLIFDNKSGCFEPRINDKTRWFKNLNLCIKRKKRLEKEGMIDLQILEARTLI